MPFTLAMKERKTQEKENKVGQKTNVLCGTSNLVERLFI